jgi:hypothetical protein
MFAKWKREAASREYAMESLAIIRRLGKVTRQEYLEMFHNMETRYPGRGWKEEADKLEKWFFNTNKPLKQIPPVAGDLSIKTLIDDPPF